MKVFIVTPIPSPYRIPLFNKLATECRKRKWSLKVVFLNPGYRRRKWTVDSSIFEFDHVMLDNVNISRGESYFSPAFTLPRALLRERPDRVIVGGFSTAALWVYLYSMLYSVPFCIWSGETDAEEMLRAGRNLRRLFRKVLIRRASVFIAYGSMAKMYLEGMGVHSGKISIGANTVDTAFMRQETERLRPGRKVWLDEHRLPALNLLFVGYLEERKGVRQVLEAFQYVRNALPAGSVALHIVGSGTQEPTLKSLVEQKGIQGVHFWGYRQQWELPQFFSIADLLVFSSLNELYGLVPIEAMAAGVPVLSSKYAGSTVDLIQHGKNGFVIDPLDLEGMAETVIQLLKDESLRKSMSEKASETIAASFSIGKSAEGFIEAIVRMGD